MVLSVNDAVMLHGAECDDAVCVMVLSVMMAVCAGAAECDDAVCAWC